MRERQDASSFPREDQFPEVAAHVRRELQG
jgi:hypothetical protein